ncbi:MAG TPA: 50S ribosomal protein L25 [Candidatus Krumholzibacteria bacterium]|nr:50S ribosomal protein L25 [Candidatus Krumholzibacteria bacterium]
MERFPLSSEPRDGAGKGVARQLRMKGRLPAVLYGRTDKPTVLSVSEVEMKGILRKHPESAIVDLSIAGGTTINAIVRDVQRHPASGKLVHIDLQRIRLDEKLRVEIHVHVTGNPIGVKEHGGILEHGTRVVNVLCLPTEIPAAIEVDATPLLIHHSIKIKDIAAAYPQVEFLDDEETTLAGVIPPNVELAAVPGVGAEGATTAEPELIRKPGAEAEGEEAAAGGKDDKKKDAKKEDKK